MKKETRTFKLNLNEETEERKMVGHAAVFSQVTQIGGWFREQIEPGAFTDSINDDDIRALFNHDPNFVLGRSTSGTLTLTEDEKGLLVSITPPDTQYARDLSVSIGRGDISQMSFAFQVEQEEWIREKDSDMDLRKIKRAKLFDVSPVTYPAYEGTDIAMRSRDAWINSLQPSKDVDIDDYILQRRKLLNRRLS